MNTQHKVIFVKRFSNGCFAAHEVTFLADTFSGGVLTLASEKYRDCAILEPVTLSPITIDVTTHFTAESGNKVPCDTFGCSFEQLEQKLNQWHQGHEIGEFHCRIHKSRAGRFGDFIDKHWLERGFSNTGSKYADGTLFNDSTKYFKG